MKWWKWIEWAGVAGLAALLALLLADVPVPVWGVGLILHVVCDFTLQTEETSTRKEERGRHLAVHSLVAGGLPGIVTGLLAGGPGWAIVGLIVGVFTHYAIDWTQKFGVQNVALGVMLDQATHVAIILALTI